MEHVETQAAVPFKAPGRKAAFRKQLEQKGKVNIQRRGLGHRDRFTNSRGRKLSLVRDFQSPMDIRFWMVMDDPEILLK